MKPAHSDPDIQIFLKRSAAHMNVNALGPDWEQDFIRSTRNLKDEAMQESFQRGFAKAILGGLTPKDFEHATGWDFDTQEEFIDHLRHHWRLFYPDTQPEAYVGDPQVTSSEHYRGWRKEEGDKVWYTVERDDGTEVVRVESLNLKDRTLCIEFTVSSPSLYDGFARQLILDKILHEVCLDAYVGRADTAAFTNLTSGRVVSVSYR
jgi:hypothetical protein